MEIIKAIALLCQLNIGVGSATDGVFSPNVFAVNTTKFIQERQQECHKYYAACMSSKVSEGRFLSCIKSKPGDENGKRTNW